MSKQLNYNNFCEANGLDDRCERSVIEYKNYCEKLKFFNSIMSRKTTEEAIEKAHKSGK